MKKLFLLLIYIPLIGYGQCPTGIGANSESFETIPTGSISQGPWAEWTYDAATSTFDTLNGWIRDNLGTASGNTGPANNAPSLDGNWYLYCETSSQFGKVANLISSCVDLNNLIDPAFVFGYNMYGATIGTLNVDVSNDGGITWVNEWTMSGNQGQPWQEGIIMLNNSYAGQIIQVRMNYTSGTSFTGDCAIDYLRFMDGHLKGCMDPFACNYDTIATLDDSSCVYPVIWQQAFSICNGDSVIVGNSIYTTSGNYTDILTASNGCDSIVYTNISLFNTSGFASFYISNYSGYNISCFGNTDGWIGINMSIGNLPFIFNWSNGQSTDSIAGLSQGNYSVEIIDTNNCIQIFSIMLDEPTPLNISVSSSDETSALNDGSANAIVTGSVPPYTYTWNDALNQTTQTAIGLAPGSYTVNVIDINGCLISDSTFINAYISTNIINTNNASQTLLEITDILGRETKGKKNEPLLYLYDDGTVEKRIIIE
jgi:hypothetical protein